MSDLPSWLRGFCEHMGWRQEDVAAYLQVHRVTVSRWMNGHSYPDATVRRRLNELAREEGFAAITPRWRR